MSTDIFYDTLYASATVQYTSGLLLDAVLEPHPNNPDKLVYIVSLPQYLDNHYDDNVTIVHRNIKPINSRRYSLMLPGDFYEDDLSEMTIRMEDGVWTVGKFVKIKKDIWRGDRVVRDGTADRSLPEPNNSYEEVQAKLNKGGWAPASRITYRTRKAITTPCSIHFIENEYTFKGPDEFVQSMQGPEDSWCDALTVPCVLHGDWDNATKKMDVHMAELVCPRAMDLSPRRIIIVPEDITKFIAKCPKWAVKAAPWINKTDKTVCPTNPTTCHPTCQKGLVMVPTSYRYKLLGATTPVRWMHEYADLVYKQD